MNINELTLNPNCHIVVGFRNKKLDKVRTKYIVFDLPQQKKIIDCILQIAYKRLKNYCLDLLDQDSIHWLIDYGFLKPATHLTFIEKIKRLKKNLLNENRDAIYRFRGKEYHVTSYVFMAFTSKKKTGFVKDRIILPFWSKTLAKTIFNMVTSANPLSALTRVSPRMIKKMMVKGLLIKKQDDIYYSGFCQKYCSLDKKLLEYLPHSNLKDNYPKDDLCLNPHLILQDSNSIHHTVADKVVNQAWISNNLPSVWIVNPNYSHMLYPYWLKEEDGKTLKELRDGQITLQQLSKETIEIFCRCGILISAADERSDELNWQAKILAARQQFQQVGYFVIQDILPPVQIAICRKYARAMLQNQLFLHDRIYGGTKKRFWQHNDGFTYFIQEQIGALITQITGNAVKPASAALTIYQAGGELPKHKDDIVAYSYVMSLVVDTQPETSRDNAWPLCVLEKGTEYCARMGMGDGLVIDPQSLHWRPGELAGHMLTIMILWYVPEDYVGYINGKWIA